MIGPKNDDNGSTLISAQFLRDHSSPDPEDEWHKTVVNQISTKRAENGHRPECLH